MLTDRSIVTPKDPRHHWRGKRCQVMGILPSRRDPKRLILALQVPGFKQLLYQWAEDFEVIGDDLN